MVSKYLLSQQFTDVITLNNPDNIYEILGKNKIDVALLDMNYTTGKTTCQEGFDLLKYFSDELPDTRVIMMTAYSDLDVAIKAIKEGADNANCIRCFFDIVDSMDGLSDKYMDKYHLIPGFKAGMHCGKVITGVVGTYKKEIVYTGDVLNTTSRIEGQCNHYKVNLLFSKDLKDKIQHVNQCGFVKIGEINLRGKKSHIALYTCERI